MVAVLLSTIFTAALLGVTLWGIARMVRGAWPTITAALAGPGIERAKSAPGVRVAVQPMRRAA